MDPSESQSVTLEHSLFLTKPAMSVTFDIGQIRLYSKFQNLDELVISTSKIQFSTEKEFSLESNKIEDQKR